MMSLIVTMPAVPPCSSITTAILVRLACSVCSSFAMDMPSGTASIERMFRSFTVEPCGMV